MDESGAPRGEKVLAFIQPPVVNQQLGIRQSALLVGRDIAATLLAAAPQYRTLNDRFDPPRFTSAEAWAPRVRYIREHILASAGLMPMPERTPLRPVVARGAAGARPG